MSQKEGKAVCPEYSEGEANVPILFTLWESMVGEIINEYVTSSGESRQKACCSLQDGCQRIGKGCTQKVVVEQSYKDDGTYTIVAIASHSTENTTKFV